MERRNQILRSASQVLIAALMAGCSAFVCMRALGFELGWVGVYLAAALSAALVQLGRKGLVRGLGAAALILGVSGLLLAKSLSGIISALQFVAENGILSGENLALHAAAGQNFGLLAAILLGAVFSLLLRSSPGTPFVLMALLAAVICSLALNENLSVWMAVPGIMAGIAAFALPVSGRFGGVRLAALIPAAVLTLIAMLFVPAQRTTWAPMENAANELRSIMEDYIQFTEQRVAFSINEKGYDRAGMISDHVVAMLGGPADPHAEPVMQVESEGDLLLRGSIKRAYTGYSWVDDQAKARYLYYDFTHRNVRGDVFGMNIAEDDPNFGAFTAKVTMLSGGTSTLFVPAHLNQFSMELSDAVYYNSIGEIFLTREVEAGDTYEFSALRPLDDNALMRAAAAGQLASDPAYEQMLAEYTSLPAGIDESVYALAVELTKNDTNPAAKALSIQNHLARNYKYTLDGSYPENGRDFVSWFLNDSKEGYCSYFASAMTVLSRIAGLPARYVEGYYVKDGQTILTGENAHAWVEIYLNGVGWTAFDPTARAMQAQGDMARQGGDEESNSDPDDHEGTPPDNTPTPSVPPGDGEPTPTPDPNQGSQDNPTPSPEPSSEPSSQPEDQDNPFAGTNDQDDWNGSSKQNKKKNPAWLWILLGVLFFLLLIAAAVLVLHRRLEMTDPLRMCVKTRSAQTAALILYRAILTLLSQAGQLPVSGETPLQFARRVVKSMPNEHYEAFVEEVVRSRYSGKNVTRATIDLGRNAYQAFLMSMNRGERLRYTLRRVLYGIGSTESIP